MKTKLFPLLSRPVVLLAALLLTALTGCEKEEQAAPPEPDLLTRHAWIMTALVAVSLEGPTDGFKNKKACKKDDLIRFAPDGTYTSEEGASTCNPGDPQIISRGTWTANAAQTQITVTEGTKETVYEVLVLTASELQLRTSKGSNSQTGTYRPAP